MLVLQNGFHVFQKETLTRKGILETELPDFSNWVWNDETKIEYLTTLACAAPLRIN